MLREMASIIYNHTLNNHQNKQKLKILTITSGKKKKRSGKMGTVSHCW